MWLNNWHNDPVKWTHKINHYKQGQKLVQLLSLNWLVLTLKHVSRFFIPYGAKLDDLLLGSFFWDYLYLRETQKYYFKKKNFL